MKKIIYVLILITAVSCLNKNDSKLDVATHIRFNDVDKNGLTIDTKLLSNIKNDLKKTPNKLNREVWNYDKEGNEEHYVLNKGVVFKFVEEQKAHSIFNAYYEQVVKGNNYIFLTNMDFDESYNTYYDIVIIDGSDPFKIIELIGTNGVNYDVYNPDIIKKLKAWDSQINFKFVVIDVSRIHAYIGKLPRDINKFSNEVYEFCPDVIDQGYGTMDEMISDYTENKYFWLWWD
ncbi:DUF4253 domain-containing protein [Psychroserpens ponticola]|uniref:DUF4253 domain-containing protein n=1 Tax=Psychroserpens ponticola TaxID=2932268 RepID=A0ABY7RT96_9FLAO|nr:DUF4253 domain-containing protein [Psychroserpens ponticola]WCO00314.1 DUF4253 domain-containing protein [Psychroserpens ponticola]